MSVCVLCGLPASGKTTFLRNVFTSCSTLQSNLIGIEYDKIIPDIRHLDLDSGKYRKSNEHGALPLDLEEAQHVGEDTDMSWKFLRRQVFMVVETLMHTVKILGKKGISTISKPDEVASDIWKRTLPSIQSLATRWQDDWSQLIIIIDDNMYFRSMRYEYFKLARKYNTGFCQVFFNISAKDAIQRNRTRAEEQRVPEDTILRMSEKLEPPDDTKYAWEHLSLAINTGGCAGQHQQIVTLLLSALSNPVQQQLFPNEEEISKSRVLCSANMLHQGDLILRKCVATWMEKSKMSGSPRDLKTQARQALRAKDVILTKLREDPHSFGVSNEWNVELASSDPCSDYYKFIAEMFVEEISKLPT